MSLPRRWIAILAVVAIGAAPDDDGFKPLVEGTDPAQFDLVEIDASTLTISEDGEIAVSGSPNGYFATKGSYTDYVLEFDFSYDRPDDLTADSDFAGNSGLLLNIEGPAKVWPRSIEFQLMYREVGKIYRIGGSQLEGEWDQSAYDRAIKPVGEWNTMKVTSDDGAMTCELNGVEVTKGKSPDPAAGQIGWQSEGAPIRFRKLRIKPLD